MKKLLITLALLCAPSAYAQCAGVTIANTPTYDVSVRLEKM